MGEWIKKRISQIGRVVSGATPSTTNEGFWNGDINWITPSDLSKVRTPFINESDRKITDLGLQSCSATLIPAHNLVISSRAPIGYFAIVQEDFTTNQGCKSIIFEKGQSSIFHYYNFAYGVNKFKEKGEGTTFAEISKGEIEKLEFLVPESFEEQTIIASILSKIDQAIEKTEQLIAKYERIKTGLMQDLLTRGIDENGYIRTEGVHEFKDSTLGRIPKEWEIRQLGNVAKFVSGRAWSFKQLSEYGLRIIRISNLHKHDFPFWFYKGSFKDEWLVKKGDILFSWAGVASSIDCVKYLGETSLLNQHIYNLKIEKEEEKEFTHRYVNWILPEIRREIEGGAGQLHLTKDKIESINIPFPKEKELLRINERLSAFERLVETENDYINKLRSQKKALMQDLLTGKVRVDSLTEKA